MKTKVSPAVVGMFVLGALALGVIALLSFGGLSLFSKPQRFMVYFDESVHGLDLGSPVKLRGVRVGRGAAARLVTAGETRRLRCQADMSHDRDAGVENCADPRERTACAFQLDRVRPGVFHEPYGVSQRFVLTQLVRAKRHVGDDECSSHTARYCAGQQQHFLHRHRERRLVTEDRHRGGIADARGSRVFAKSDCASLVK